LKNLEVSTREEIGTETQEIFGAIKKQNGMILIHRLFYYSFPSVKFQKNKY
jgi:hypothetical protein